MVWLLSGTAVVGHINDKAVRAVVERDDGSGGPGVLHNVSEGFLHDPERGEAEARIQLASPA